MSRKLVVGLSLIAATNAMWFLSAQEFNTTKVKPQYSNAEQPAKGTAPPTRAKPPLDRPPRLTDPATDENGHPLLSTKLEPVDAREVVDTVRIANPDRVLATWIALGNKEEMALAELGIQRAADQGVKDFAKLVFDDHAALDDMLKTYAPDIATPSFLNTTAKDARQLDTPARKRASEPVAVITPDPAADDVPPTKSERRPTEPRPTAANRDFNVEQIERELAVQQLASSRKMLTDRRGSEFDRFFVVQQIVMHKSLRDKLIVYQRHVSAPLANVLADAERACDEHMAKAMDLIKKLPGPTTVSGTPAVKSVQKAATDR